MTICLAPRGACGGGVLRSRFTCRVFGRASILASPSLERRRMTKMPPDGYPALQYLQSVRVRKFSPGIAGQNSSPPVYPEQRCAARAAPRPLSTKTHPASAPRSELPAAYPLRSATSPETGNAWSLTPDGKSEGDRQSRPRISMVARRDGPGLSHRLLRRGPSWLRPSWTTAMHYAGGDSRGPGVSLSRAASRPWHDHEGRAAPRAARRRAIRPLC